LVSKSDAFILAAKSVSGENLVKLRQQILEISVLRMSVRDSRMHAPTHWKHDAPATTLAEA